jgi:hypothetical protein
MLSGCAMRRSSSEQSAVTLSEKDTLDVLEAALRYRLTKFPLPQHGVCYVYIEHTEKSLPQFAKRFPEYHMIMRYGSPGNSPPSPWRDLWLGGTTQDHAWVIVTDATDSTDSMAIELCRRDHRWIAVGEAPPVIT